MRNTFLLLAVLLVHWVNSQDYPQNYFNPPLSIELALSGTFGELRGNHYHSGIDFKTQGREGLPVLASAAGRVVRIKVSAYGYGNALYIAHPNGYTTVYAHLKRFTPEIDAWVKTQQYAKQSFEVDLFPPAIFSFNQGDTIALSGNTGGSGGPHLHFEIRHTKTEETINPALFGLPIKDHKKPIISRLYVTPITAGTTINGRISQQEIALSNLGNGVYTGDISASGMIGFVVQTIDQQDLSNNNNGIYRLTQLVNDTPTYQFEIERFSFDETRYINAHMDYARYRTSKQLTHKCYVEPGDKFGRYKHVINGGVVSALNNGTRQVTILVEDAWGNASEIRLNVRSFINHTLTAIPENVVHWNEPYSVKADPLKVQIAPGTLYHDEVLEVKQKKPCYGCLTAVYAIGEEIIPAHKRYQLGIHKSALKDHDKLVWAIISPSGHKSGLTTNWQGDWLMANPREFGHFAVLKDTIAPMIKVQQFTSGKQVTKGAQLQLTATDNLSGITKYEAFIDDQWILLAHDAKRNLWWHTFGESPLAEGLHTIIVRMIDEVGNTSTWQSVFTYKP
jgi:murein DD-endopeptidase MepM/ murein hydrolase activator NlpD